MYLAIYPYPTPQRVNEVMDGMRVDGDCGLPTGLIGAPSSSSQPVTVASAVVAATWPVYKHAICYDL